MMAGELFCEFLLFCGLVLLAGTGLFMLGGEPFWSAAWAAGWSVAGGLLVVGAQAALGGFR